LIYKQERDGIYHYLLDPGLQL